MAYRRTGLSPCKCGKRLWLFVRRAGRNVALVRCADCGRERRTEAKEAWSLPRDTGKTEVGQ
jgi:hypothetical protein